MKAQELRDRLAAVRNFNVVVDDDTKIDNVVIDIVNSTVYLYTKPLPKDDEFTRIDAKPKSEMDKLFTGLTKKGDEKDDAKGTIKGPK